MYSKTINLYLRILWRLTVIIYRKNINLRYKQHNHKLEIEENLDAVLGLEINYINKIVIIFYLHLLCSITTTQSPNKILKCLKLNNTYDKILKMRMTSYCHFSIRNTTYLKPINYINGLNFQLTSLVFFFFYEIIKIRTIT